MGRILDACPGGCGRRNVALCARGVCGACYNRLPDVAARRNAPAAPRAAPPAPAPEPAPKPAAPAVAHGKVKARRLYCPRCGRSDLIPHPMHPDRVPGHVRPARQQKAVRVICKAA